MGSARIDKWLWAVRIFKTRSMAAEACKKGRILLNGTQAKPAHTIKEGDIVSVKKPPITWSFKVLQSIEKRVGAKLVPSMMENVTAPDQLELLEVSKISGLTELKGQVGLPRRSVANWKILLTQSFLETSTLTLTAMTKKILETNQ